MAKQYIQIYYDCLEALEELTDVERGRLFVALLKYGMSGAAEKLNGNERYLYSMMRKQIDRDNKSYDEKCRENKEKGKLGGRPKKPNGFEDNQTVIEKPNGFKITQEEEKEEEKEKEKDFKEICGGDGDACARTPERLFPKYFGRAPTEAERESCQLLINRHDFDVLEIAFFRACKADKKTLGYVSGILKNYLSRGVKDIGDVALDDMRHEGQKRSRRQ